MGQGRADLVSVAVAVTLSPAQLAQARTAQEMLMVSTGVIREPGDSWQWDGQQSVPVDGATIYDGPLRIQPERQQARTTPAGEQDRTTAIYVGAVPWHVTGLHKGLTLQVTGALDPDLIGREFTLAEVEVSGLYVTARRFKASLIL